MPQEAPGTPAGLLAINERWSSVHQNVSISPRPLNPPPVPARQVVSDFLGQHLKGMEVIHDYVGRRPDFEDTSVVEARAEGGEGAQTPMSVLK